MNHNEFIPRLTYEDACKRVFSNKDIEKIKYLSKRYDKSFSQTLNLLLIELIFYFIVRKYVN